MSVKRQRGFTLIELLIAVALIAVIAALAYGVLFQGLVNFTAESEDVEAQSNVRYALTYLSRQIRKGESVSVLASYESYGVALLIDKKHYYYNDNKVYEDLTPLVAAIGSMTVSQSENRITMTITSTADSRGNTVSETMDIFLRE